MQIIADLAPYLAKGFLCTAGVLVAFGLLPALSADEKRRGVHPAQKEWRR